MAGNVSVVKRVARGVLGVLLGCSLCSIAHPLAALGEETSNESMTEISSSDEVLSLLAQEVGQDTRDMYRLYNPNSGEHF